MSYTQVTVSGYNSSPPADDGSTSASNQVFWSTIKTKLGDPLKTAIEAIDDNVASAIATTDTYPATWAAADTALQSTIQSTLRGELNAPSTTAMLFVQTSAPTGWTKVTTHNDKALRLVSGTVGTGGSTAFTSVFTSRTITEANLPAHTHGVGTLATASAGLHAHTLDNATNVISDLDTGVSVGTGSNNWSKKDISVNSNGAHTHTITGATDSVGSGTPMDFAVQYVDVIYATKN